MANLVTLWPLFDEEDEDYDEFDGGPGPSGGTPPLVTFPTTDLISRAMIALGADLSADPGSWNWADITDKVRWDLGVSLTTGRRDEQSTVTTGSAQLKLDNRDGRFTRRNPMSPYWGLLSKNTPIWVTVDAGSGEKTRLEMFVNEWPKRWSDKSATDSTVTIRCAGILRRLGQGSVLKSALRRAVTFANPTAYWPMEDGPDASQLVSGLLGGSALRPINTAYVSLGTVNATGTLPYTEFTAQTNTIGGGIESISLTDSGLGATKFSVSLVMTGTMPSPAITTDWDLFSITTTTVGIFCYATAFCATSGGVVGTNYGIDVWYSGGAGARAFSFGTINPFDGNQHSLLCTWEQIGADVHVSMTLDDVAGTSATVAGQTLGSPVGLSFVQPKGLVFGDTGNNTGGRVGLGHFALWGNVTAPDPYQASIGYRGEQAHIRIARLCAEEHIPYFSSAPYSSTMGPQPVGSLLTLLREAEAVGGGVLYEKHFGLAYQSLAERYNAPVAMAIDIAANQLADLPEPADDDQRTRNRWTVSRVNGSQYMAEQTTGPMGTGTEGPGVWDDSIMLNTQTDAQLKQQAERRVLLGIIDEDRHPAVGLNFAHNPDLIDTWCTLGYGARLTVASPLAQMPPGSLDQVIEGYSEGWNSKVWTASLNCAPFTPYRIFVLAGPDDDLNPSLGYLVPTTCVLAEDLDTTETGVDITTTPLWSTAAADWTPPPTITVDGEDMTVTAVSGAGNPQTLTVLRSANGVVKIHSTGAAVTFKFPGFLGL